jgi:hypothetical protein
VAAAGYVAQRGAGNRIAGRHPGLEGRQIGKELEGGAWLPQRLDPIEAGAGVITTAHVGQDVAGAGVEGDQRTLGEPHRGGRALQKPLQLGLGQGLNLGVNRAEHCVIAGGVLAAQIQAEACALQLADHVVGKEGIAGEAGFAAGGRINVQRPALGIDQGLIAEPALLVHQFEHQIATLEAGAGVMGVARAIAVGAGQQPHQEGRLSLIKIAG